MVNNCSTQVCTSDSEQQTNTQEPRYYVNTDKHESTVFIELPGVNKQDVSVEMERNILTVFAKREILTKDDWKPIHRELNQPDYRLRLRLTNEADDEQISAALEDGVLKVRVPVQETARPRRIEVE